MKNPQSIVKTHQKPNEKKKFRFYWTKYTFNGQINKEMFADSKKTASPR
ncbi:hypothetical protein RintRC_1269 [Richelia intracellularis]|nr:hypothetical protein RintRC_1269 [Richelia intracellularis]